MVYTSKLHNHLRLFVNEKLATVPNYQFVVLSSLHYQQPRLLKDPKLPPEMTVAKKISIELESRDREGCKVLPEDYELAGLPVVKKDLTADVVQLGVNGELRAEIRNA